MLPGGKTDLPPIRRLDRIDAADGVGEQLTALIASGQLNRGDRLPSEKSLGEAFGVSRPVIREALRGLRSLGLIVSKPGSGSYVASESGLPRPLLLGLYSAPELHEVRTQLEVPGAGHAAGRATDAQIESLRDIVRRMEEGCDRRSFAELDAAFHIALAECTANAVQVRLVSDLAELIVENSDVALAADESRQVRATREHRRIAEAVARRDASAAEAAMLRHLTRVSRLMRSHFGRTSRPDGDRGGRPQGAAR
jgi:GntR family transcriptional regulator, transcriptional repressor for pyruvate dehydrogenase complex